MIIIKIINYSKNIIIKILTFYNNEVINKLINIFYINIFNKLQNKVHKLFIIIMWKMNKPGLP